MMRQAIPSRRTPTYAHEGTADSWQPSQQNQEVRRAGAGSIRRSCSTTSCKLKWDRLDKSAADNNRLAVSAGGLQLIDMQLANDCNALERADLLHYKGVALANMGRQRSAEVILQEAMGLHLRNANSMGARMTKEALHDVRKLAPPCPATAPDAYSSA